MYLADIKLFVDYPHHSDIFISHQF